MGKIQKEFKTLLEKCIIKELFVVEIPNLYIGRRCSVMMHEGELYPAIYLDSKNNIFLVYVNHLDQAVWVNYIEEEEVFPLEERCTPIEYSCMEAPSLFRLGTTIGIKWGNNSYQVGDGRKMDVLPTTVVDKINPVWRG